MRWEGLIPDARYVLTLALFHPWSASGNRSPLRLTVGARVLLPYQPLTTVHTTLQFPLRSEDVGADGRLCVTCNQLPGSGGGGRGCGISEVWLKPVPHVRPRSP